jgi:hypothetical protein
MSDRLRVIRDQIQSGDDVLVLNHGPKPREARVVEVLRSAVRVRYADAPGILHTVLLKHVQRVEAPTPPPTLRASSPPPAPRASTLPPAPRDSSPRVKPAPKLDEQPAVDAERAKRVELTIEAAFAAAGAGTADDDKTSELGTWLELGREVLKRVNAERAQALDQIDMLVKDIAELTRELDALRQAVAEIEAQQARIMAVLK